MGQEEFIQRAFISNMNGLLSQHQVKYIELMGLSEVISLAYNLAKLMWHRYIDDRREVK